MMHVRRALGCLVVAVFNDTNLLFYEEGIQKADT